MVWISGSVVEEGGGRGLNPKPPVQTINLTGQMEKHLTTQPPIQIANLTGWFEPLILVDVNWKQALNHQTTKPQSPIGGKLIGGRAPAVGSVVQKREEQHFLAFKVEVAKCNACGQQTRFPRREP